MIAQIVALSPLLIVSLGIVFGLLLIATSRSQKIIQWFSLATLLLAFCSSMTQLAHPSIAVTPLVFVDAFSNFSQGLIYIVCAFATGLSYQYLKNQVEVHDEFLSTHFAFGARGWCACFCKSFCQFCFWALKY